jgi:hypothetical protein
LQSFTPFVIFNHDLSKLIRGCHPMHDVGRMRSSTRCYNESLTFGCKRNYAAGVMLCNDISMFPVYLGSRRSGKSEGNSRGEFRSIQLQVEIMIYVLPPLYDL